MTAPRWDPEAGRWELPGDQHAPPGSVELRSAPSPQRRRARTTAPTGGPYDFDRTDTVRYRPAEPATPESTPPPGAAQTVPAPVRPVRPARPATEAAQPPVPRLPAVPVLPSLPRQRRQWPWLVGSAAGMMFAFLVGVVVGAVPTASAPLGVADASGATSPLAGAPTAGGETAPFLLEVSSRLGRELDLRYTTPTGATSRPQGEGTWSIAITRATRDGSGEVTGSTHTPYSLGSRQDERPDTVTCRITDARGTVVDEQSGSGVRASATCRGY